MFLEDIRANGIHDLIHVDEDNVILDGHHRYKAAKTLGIEEVTIKVHYGLTEDEKKGFAHLNNVLKREISKEEKIKKAIELRKEGRSYRQIGEWLGVNEKTVRNWLKEIPTEELSAVGKVEGDDGKLRPSEMPTDTELAERREKVKALRSEGKKVDEIVEALGKSKSTIYTDIKAIEQDEINEDKRNRRKKHEQSLGTTAYEVKTRADLYPDLIEDEPVYSTPSPKKKRYSEWLIQQC